MHTTSDSQPPKRASAKAKSESPRPTVTIKKPRARKVAPDAEPVEPVPAAAPQGASTERTTEELNHMIATTAYFLAEERGFTPGHELEDWLEAERRVIGFG